MYFEIWLVSAFATAGPAECALPIKWETEKVHSVTVASHIRLLATFQGKMAIPSGLRPSSWLKPVGFAFIQRKHVNKFYLTFGLRARLYTFLVNIELALKTVESADDMTAAATAPSPTKDTAGGVKYCITKGNTWLG